MQYRVHKNVIKTGEKMRNANLIADELHNAGFRTKVVTSTAVKVSLTSRTISTIEVETALGQIFDNAKYNLRSLLGEVIVSI